MMFRRRHMAQKREVIASLSPINPTPEQVEAMAKAYPDLLRQLAAMQVVAQREHEQSVYEYTKAWIRSFGVEVSSG